MNSLKCLILNAAPYGAKGDNGVGTNTVIQFIPLDKSKCVNKDSSYGYYVSYNVIWDKSNKSYFDKIKKEDLILVPVEIAYTLDINKHCVIDNIKKI